MLSHLVVRNAAIKVLIETRHKIINLGLGDGKAHAFQQVVELFHVNVVVFIDVDLFEDILQSKAPLLQDLDQVVKNLILRVFLFAFQLKLFDYLSVVLPVEVLEFLIQQDSVLV